MGFMRVEHPPQMESGTDGEAFLRVLGEMIVIGLGRGNELADLTVNVSNVTVERVHQEPRARRLGYDVVPSSGGPQPTRSIR
jgi:hypothetical protein